MNFIMGGLVVICFPCVSSAYRLELRPPSREWLRRGNLVRAMSVNVCFDCAYGYE